MSTLVATPATIAGTHLRNLVEATLDSDDPPRVARRWHATLAGRKLAVSFVDERTLSAVIPKDLPPGVHDLHVTTPAGERLVLADALTVVDAPLGLRLSIEDRPRGEGAAVGARQVEAGTLLALHAIARQADGTYVTDVPVRWMLEGDPGALDGVVPTRASAALFEARRVGSARVRVEAADNEPVETGLLEVLAAHAEALAIETRADGSGEVLGEPHGLTTDDALELFAIARDRWGNFVANVGALWSVDGDIAVVKPAVGPGTVLELTASGSGRARATAAGLPEATTATLHVAPGRAAALQVSPATADLSADDAPLAFALAARDADGNVTTDVGTVKWDVAGGSIAELDASSGVLVPVRAGAGVIRATSSHGAWALTRTVVVRPGRVAALAIEPRSIALSADDAPFALRAVGVDSEGNPTAEVGPLSWQVADGPIGDLDAATGVLTPARAGTGRVRVVSARGLVADSGAVTIAPGRAASLAIEPASLSLPADAAPVPFRATARDADGNATADVGALSWSLVGTASSIDAATGVFTPTRAGSGRLTVSSSHGPSAESGSIVVTPGRAAALTVVPASLVVSADDAPVRFAATATDADGNATADTGTLAWSIDAGAITAIDVDAGVFAPTRAGTGRIAVTSSLGPVARTGEIVVTPGRATTLAVQPATASLTADDPTLSFAVDARDADGNATADTGSLAWTIASGSIGDLDAATGAFTPARAGEGVVRVTSASGLRADSGPVRVTPGRVAALEVSPRTLGVTADHAGVTFTAAASDADGNPTTNTGTLSWSIAAGPIAELDATTGVFTPTRAGTGRVRVTSSFGPAGETGEVVVTPGRAAFLTIVPGTLSLRADDAPVPFRAAAVDADGNATTNAGTLTWSIASGSITDIGATTGVFTPKRAGGGTVRVKSSLGPTADTGLVTVAPGRAASLVATPETLVLSADAPSVTFRATATDADGNATADVGTVTWAAGGIGAIDAATGVFTPARAGTGRVRATSSHGPSDETGDVTVTPGRAISLAISPASLALSADAPPMAFEALAVDGDGNAASAGTLTWSIPGGTFGAIDPATGVLTPSRAGVGRVRATSSLGLQAETGLVAIRPGRAVSLAIRPATLLTTQGGVPTSFGVAGPDADGNATTDFGALSWSVDGTFGALDAATGVLTPALPGSGRVRVASSLGLEAFSGAVTVRRAAALALARWTVPAAVSTGQRFDVAFELANTGESDASEVVPCPLAASGTASASVEWGPEPAQGALAAGAGATYTATLVAGSGGGALRLAACAVAVDAGTGRVVAMDPSSSPDIEVQRAAALSAAITAPARVLRGATFGVSMDVTNTGEALATGVGAGPLVASGTASIALVAGPGASADLAGGASRRLEWTYAAVRTGTLAFAGAAAGTDANSGETVTSASATAAASVVEVEPILDDPLGDGTPFAFVVPFAGRVYVGPRANGAGAARFLPDGSGAESVALELPRDPNGTTTSNTSAAPYPSLGAPACTPNTHACGPDNEDGRGFLTSGFHGGAEWLVAGGARSAGGTRYVYATRDADRAAALSYVDLRPAVDGGERGLSSAHFFRDRLYLGLARASSDGPSAFALLTMPVAPGLDAARADVVNLEMGAFPAFAGQRIEIIDAITDFNDRLYIASRGGLLRSTTPTPGSYRSSGADWAPATPSAAAFANEVSLPAARTAQLEPRDRAFPALVAFRGRLFAARNTTAGPQLWACEPGLTLSLADCDPADWSLVAANSAGEPSLTQFDNPANAALTLLAATSRHLYVGFDNAAGGIVLFRSSAPTAERSSFEGRDGCPASLHPSACEGLGGGGAGNAANTRIADGRALSFDGRSYVYVVAGDGAGPVRVVRVGP